MQLIINKLKSCEINSEVYLIIKEFITEYNNIYLELSGFKKINIPFIAVQENANKLEELEEEILSLANENISLQEVNQKQLAQIKALNLQLTPKNSQNNKEKKYLSEIKELHNEIAKLKKDKQYYESASVKNNIAKLKATIKTLTTEKDGLFHALQDKEMQVAQIKRLCPGSQLKNLSKTLNDYTTKIRSRGTSLYEGVETKPISNKTISPQSRSSKSVIINNTYKTIPPSLKLNNTIKKEDKVNQIKPNNTIKKEKINQSNTNKEEKKINHSKPNVIKNKVKTTKKEEKKPLSVFEKRKLYDMELKKKMKNLHKK